MYSSKEQFRPPLPKESLTFESITRKIPDAIHMAKLEVESSDMAKTPEGKFAATYLLATRNLLQPVLRDIQSIGSDFLIPIGGQDYNPERSIDEVGSLVAEQLSDMTSDIPTFFLRTEESAQWENVNKYDSTVKEGKRFAVIDPLDMTSSIEKKEKVQTSGIAIFDQEGNVLTVGITSLVDDGFVFIEKQGEKLHVFPKIHQTRTDQYTDDHIRVATLKRRMHKIRQTPLITSEKGEWVMDCASGYSVLGLLHNKVDTVIDPFKGNPWYEVAIWVNAAQQLGFPVSDKDGNPIDIPAAIRRMIDRHEGDSFRIPFIISRTQDIHNTVLPLLKERT